MIIYIYTARYPTTLIIYTTFLNEVTPSRLYSTQEVHETEPPSTMNTGYKELTSILGIFYDNLYIYC